MSGPLIPNRIHWTMVSIDTKVGDVPGPVWLENEGRRNSTGGAGFNRRRRATSGALGLITVRERASQLGGGFDVESVPGAGTTIKVVIPFR